MADFISKSRKLAQNCALSVHKLELPMCRACGLCRRLLLKPTCVTWFNQWLVYHFSAIVRVADVGTSIPTRVNWVQVLLVVEEIYQTGPQKVKLRVSRELQWIQLHLLFCFLEALPCPCCRIRSTCFRLLIPIHISPLKSEHLQPWSTCVILFV